MGGTLGRTRARRRPQAGMRGRFGALALAVLLALGAMAPAVLAQDGDELSGRTAVVSGSGDGVNLRAEPEFGAEVILAVADGTEVELRIDVADTVLDPDGRTRWWPVAVYGESGWVAGYYLDVYGDGPQTEGGQDGQDGQDGEGETQAETETDAEIEGEAAPGEEPAADGEFLGTDTLVARITSPDGANLRAEPSADAEVVAVVQVDTPVDLRTDVLDTVYEGEIRWWPVTVDGQDGWVAGDYLGEAGGSPAADAPPAEDSAAKFAPGSYAAALTDEGGGVNIRAEATADAERVGFVEEGDVVQVMDGPVGFDDSAAGWYLVTDGEVTGFADGDLLVAAAQPAPPAEAEEPAPEPEPEPAVVLDPAKFGAGDLAAADTRDGSGVNLRSDATLRAERIGILPEGAVVEIEEGPGYDARGNDWYLVTYDGVTGWAVGDLLDAAAAPGAEEMPAAPAEAAPAPATAGQATGGFVAPLASYTITQYYGCSPFAFEPYDPAVGCNFHNGIDLAAPAYTPLLAADGGTVTYAGWCDCGLGFYVEIDHGNGFATVYGHMAEQPIVATGQAVARGQGIGPLGSTGLSTGPHVHFMVKIGGATVDPLGYVPL